MADDSQLGAERVDRTELTERVDPVGRTLHTSVSNPQRIRL